MSPSPRRGTLAIGEPAKSGLDTSKEHRSRDRRRSVSPQSGRKPCRPMRPFSRMRNSHIVSAPSKRLQGLRTSYFIPRPPPSRAHLVSSKTSSRSDALPTPSNLVQANTSRSPARPVVLPTNVENTPMEVTRATCDSKTFAAFERASLLHDNAMAIALDLRMPVTADLLSAELCKQHRHLSAAEIMQLTHSTLRTLKSIGVKLSLYTEKDTVGWVRTLTAIHH